jgi:hypothetical protein
VVVVAGAVVVAGGAVVTGAGAVVVADVVPATTPALSEPATANPSTNGKTSKTRFTAGKV